MFVIDGPITNKTVRRLSRYIRNHVEEILHVYLNTPGGCTRSALAIFEMLRTMSEAHGRTVVVQAVDEVFSAGLVIFLAGDHRLATNYTRFLIHEVTLEEQRRMTAKTYMATAGDLEKETEILYNLIKSRCKMTMTTLKKKVKAAPENDYIFDCDEAFKYGMVTQKGFVYLPSPEAQEIEIEMVEEPASTAAVTEVPKAPKEKPAKAARKRKA